MMAVDVRATSATFDASVPKPLFEPRLGTATGAAYSIYAVSADGKRFLFPTRTGQTTATPITVVLNWQAAGK